MVQKDSHRPLGSKQVFLSKAFGKEAKGVRRPSRLARLYAAAIALTEPETAWVERDAERQVQMPGFRPVCIDSSGPEESLSPQPFTTKQRALHRLVSLGLAVGETLKPLNFTRAFQGPPSNPRGFPVPLSQAEAEQPGTSLT